MKGENRMKKFILLIPLIFLSFFALTKPASAFEMRSSDNLTVPVSEVVDGALFVSGNSVNVSGIVNGDLYCAGQNVTITGTVDGDVMCAGQHVALEGTVTGNVRAVGQIITVSGQVNKNVTVLGQDLTVTNKAVIGKDLFAMTQSMTVNGVVTRDIGSLGDKFLVNGKVGRNTQAGASTLVFGNGASMGGSFTYWAPKEVVVDPSVAIAGPVTFHRVENAKPMQAKKTEAKESKTHILWSIVSWMIGGIILVALFPKYGKRLVNLMEDKPWSSVLVGLVTGILVPIVIVFFLITIIGIPVSLLLGVIWAGVMFLSRLPVAYIIGKQIVRLVVPKKTISRLVPILVGVPVTLLVFEIPVFGWILASFAGLWGTGGFVMTLKKRS